jgi:hypothetical protein
MHGGLVTIPADDAPQFTYQAELNHSDVCLDELVCLCPAATTYN